jgi:hypothetical protein
MFTQYIHDLRIPSDPVNHAYDLDVVILNACFFRHNPREYRLYEKEKFSESGSPGDIQVSVIVLSGFMENDNPVGIRT